MYEEEGSEEGPAGTYAIYRAEGDALCKQGNYTKAIESYSTALELRPGDKTCLVCRSKCQLQLGDTNKALEDAEASLSEDKDYPKGIFAKAEALYSRGEFELALMFYHRGNKLRPEVQEFRLGIQKAQEAIDNAVGSPAKVKLTKDGDLTFFVKQDEKGKNKKKDFNYSKPLLQSEDKKRVAPPATGDDRTVKQLLGELYGDKQFLEKILRETDTTSRSGQTIFDLAYEGLTYLDTRTEFWRQQKPMYSRTTEKQERARSRRAKKGNHEQYVVSELEKIDLEQVEGLFEASLKRANKCLKYVQDLSDKDVPNRHAILASLHSCIGNCYLEMNSYKKALDNHQMDLDIANDNDLEEAKSRALDNLGRVYARSGEFQKAIDVWEEKVPLSKSALESAWLYHEIGRCYLEMSKHEQAKSCGEKATNYAEEAADDMWKLNALMLVGQAEVKLGEYKSAIDIFEKSLDVARLLSDSAAEAAIKRALDDVNIKIVQDIKDKLKPIEESKHEEQQQSEGTDTQPPSTEVTSSAQ